MISPLPILAVIISGLVSYSIFRWYGESILSRNLESHEKMHRLRVALYVVAFSTIFILGTLVFLGRPFPSPAVNIILFLVSSMAVLFFSFTTFFSYDRKIRGTDAGTRKAIKKLSRVAAMSSLPPVAIFLAVLVFPGFLTKTWWVLLVIMGVALLVSFSLAPYMRILFKDTKPLEAEKREMILSFVKEREVSPPAVRVEEGSSTKTANATFTGTLPGAKYCFVTDYLLENFPDEEIKAVLAHEIGHLKNRDLLVKILASISFFGILFLISWILSISGISFGDSESFPSFVLIVPVIYLFHRYVVQGVLSQFQEYKADKYAAETVGRENVINALHRLGEVNVQKKETGLLYNLLTFHPSIGERIRKVKESKNFG